MKLTVASISHFLCRTLKMCLPVLTAMLLASCASNQQQYLLADDAFYDGDYLLARQGYELYLQGEVDGINEDGALLALGEMYLLGLGGEQDVDKAIFYLKQVNLSSNVDKAQHLLAELFLYGYGVDRDVSRAIELYEKADSRRATLDLALLYWQGIELPKSQDKSLTIVNELIEALERSNGELSYLLYHPSYARYCRDNYDAVFAFNRGGCLSKGDRQLIKSAEALWQQRDKKSEMFAAELVIKLYLATVNRQEDELFAWFHWAATQGDATSQRVLATAYLQGDGVAQDFTNGVYWMEKAAVQADPEAAFLMGQLSLNTNETTGSTPDYHSAITFFKLAAEQGHLDAMLSLVNLYLNPPTGLARDIHRGITWLELAAESGDNRVRHYLADSYFKAELGLSHKHPEAMKIYRELYYAADDVKAAYHLGVHYALGSETIEKQPRDAVNWLTTAAEDGYLPAKLALANFLMTIDRAEQAANWREKVIYLDLANVSATQAKAIASLQYKQARYYLDKNNPKYDSDQAVRLLTMAADANNDKAQALLGLLYYEGREVAKDWDMAYRWLSAWESQIVEAKKRLAPNASVWDEVVVELPFSNNAAKRALLELKLWQYEQ